MVVGEGRARGGRINVQGGRHLISGFYAIQMLGSMYTTGTAPSPLEPP
jgi:hypothetical protein